MCKSLAAFLLAFALFMATPLIFAQDAAEHPPGDTESLEARVTRLERENQELKATVMRRLPEVESAVSDDGYYRIDAGGGGGDAEAAVNADPTIADRLKALEKDYQKQADAAAKKKADDASKPTIKFGGRVHADYWAFPETDAGANAYETGSATNSVDDRFLFRRVRLEISGTIPDNMVYRLQVDFNNPNSPQLKDVYLGFEELPILQTVLVGNQKRPYGLDHLNSSKYNVFLERPEIIECINQDARRFGVCSYGVSDDEFYNWRFGGFMGQDLQNTGNAQATPLVEAYQAEFAGRFANTIWYDEASEGRGFAHWAVSGTVAGTDGNAGGSSTARFQSRPEARTTARWVDTGTILNAQSYQMLGLETLVNWGPLQVVGEYQTMAMQRSVGSDLNFDGGYVYASYFLTGESMTWDRKSGTLARIKPFESFFLVRTCEDSVEGGWGAWQLAARYSHADFTDDNIAGGVSDEFTLGLNWHWNAYSRMQFNYIIGEIADHRPIDGQTSAQFQILGTRFMTEW